MRKKKEGEEYEKERGIEERSDRPGETEKGRLTEHTTTGLSAV